MDKTLNSGYVVTLWVQFNKDLKKKTIAYCNYCMAKTKTLHSKNSWINQWIGHLPSLLVEFLFYFIYFFFFLLTTIYLQKIYEQCYSDFGTRYSVTDHSLANSLPTRSSGHSNRIYLHETVYWFQIASEL